MNKEAVRALLPECEKKNFDDIVLQRVLGASKHINMISQMLLSIASQQADGNEIAKRILMVADYFKETRGKASQAVTNAIVMLTKGIRGNYSLSETEIRKIVIKNQEEYAKTSQINLSKIVEYGVKLAEPMETIMVFDYSSTIDTFLANMKQGRNIYIPESRTIDGGHGFVTTCLKAGHQVKFFPDAAMLYWLKDCDGIFIGAETFYLDGTVFNTTGSDILAFLCKKYNIPYYVMTPMIKIDTRSRYGLYKETVMNDLSGMLAGGWSEKERESVDFICPELLPISPEYISAYVTEYGITPTEAIFTLADGYLLELE